MKYFWQFFGIAATIVMGMIILYFCWFQKSLPALSANVNTGTQLGVVQITPVVAVGLLCIIFTFIEVKMADFRPPGWKWDLLDKLPAVALFCLALSIVFAWAGFDLYSLVSIPTPTKNMDSMNAVWLCGAAAFIDLLDSLFGGRQPGRLLQRGAVLPETPALLEENQPANVRVVDRHVAHINEYVTRSPPQVIDIGPNDDPYTVRLTGTLRTVEEKTDK